MTVLLPLVLALERILSESIELAKLDPYPRRLPWYPVPGTAGTRLESRSRSVIVVGNFWTESDFVVVMIGGMRIWIVSVSMVMGPMLNLRDIIHFWNYLQMEIESEFVVCPGNVAVVLVEVAEEWSISFLIDVLILLKLYRRFLTIQYFRDAHFPLRHLHCVHPTVKLTRRGSSNSITMQLAKWGVRKLYRQVGERTTRIWIRLIQKTAETIP